MAKHRDMTPAIDPAIAEPDSHDDPLRAGAEPEEVVRYIDGLVLESIEARRKYMPAATMDNNLRLYLGDQLEYESTGELDVYTFNKIQNLVIAASAVQTELQPLIDLQPRDTGRPPAAFLKPEVAAMLKPQIDAGALVLPVQPRPTPGQLAGVEPFTNDQYEDLLSIPRMAPQPVQAVDATTGAAIDTGQTRQTPVIDPATGQEQKLFTPDDFHLVDDNAVADLEQTLIDIKWEEAAGPLVVRENTLNTNCLGIGPVFVDYDHRFHRFTFDNINAKRFYPDPRESSYARCGYQVYDRLLSKAEAIHLFPDHRAAIEAKVTKGFQRPMTGQVEDWGETDTEIEYEREMVIVRCAWLRYQSYPATEAEALRYGWVRQRIRQQPAVDPAGNALSEMVDVAEYYIPDDDDDNDYEKGEATAPGEANWPQNPNCIREIIIVADELVSDGRSKFNDLRVPWNKCVPIPYRPWAQGMPERVEPIQRAINMLGTNFVIHSGYHANPMEVVGQEVADELRGSDFDEAGSFPGRRIRVSQELYERTNGKIITIIDPASMPESLARFWVMLMELFDDVGGRPDSIQGKSSPDAKSGVAIQALQQAARGIFGYLSLHTQDVIRQIVQLMLHITRHEMAEHEIARCLGDKLPVPVMRAILARAKGVQYDITVEIASAGGATRQQEEAQIRLDRAAGLRSTLATMKKIRVPNPEQELAEIQAERMAMQPPMAMPAGSAAAAAAPAGMPAT